MPFDDVRMRGFRERTAVAAVLELLQRRVTTLEAERAASVSVAGRVLAEAVIAPIDVPGFDRAAMDGHAVRAADTAAVLTRIGEALPAKPFPGAVGPGEAVVIMTGAPLPVGADAVLKAEAADVHGDQITPREVISAGKNVGRIGEDVKRGTEVLPPGRRLRPQDVGLLAALGVAEVPVVRRPRVALLATGDELLPPGSAPTGCRIVDSNSPMLAALVERDGGIPLPVQSVPDRSEAVRDAIRSADADLVLVSGGSSVGQEDHAPRAVAELGELAVHGIAIRPAGPTGVGFLGSRPVFLLPGNPVSCLCAYDLFAGRAVRKLGGRDWNLPHRTITVPLGSPLASQPGRVDYIRAKMVNGRAEPLGGGASLLSTTVAADGFFLIDSDTPALAAGEHVMLHLYDA